MSRALKHDMPGPDWRVSPDALRERGLEAIFAPELAPSLQLVVEIGFGRGELLLALAEKNPDVAYLGIEYSFKRVLKQARRLARQQALRNVRLVNAPAEGVLEALPEASVGTFWINFPDPWPKKRHQRRRLIQPALVRALAQRLAPGGRLEIATDHVGYAGQIDAVLAAEPLLGNPQAPALHVHQRPERPPTAYELEWAAAGRTLHYWTRIRR
jgi:tRNA (guanine-N7-)-methyltransferase